MKLNSIQSKIGGALILILLIILGISFTIAALQSRQLLQTQQKHALKTIHTKALEEADSIFECLEIGTRGSLERGEMDVFDELLTGLGSVPGVLEVGLVNPQGTTIYSSNKDKLGQKQPHINITSTKEKINIKKENTNTFFVAHSHSFEQKCMECHDDAEIGSLAGVLYLDFSLDKLNQVETQHKQDLAAASSKSMVSNLGMGLISIIVTWLALFFILRKMIVRPISKIKILLTDIGKGHLNNRLNLTQQDELGDTARTLDTLAESLQTEVVAPLQQLANGDLTFDVTPHDENDTLRHAIKKLGEDLTQMVAGLQIAGQQIDSGSSQVSDSAQLLSDGAAQSAASVEEISSSMNEIGSQTNTSAENAQQANQLSASARKAANAGSERMTEMIGAMGEINEAGQNISKIIKVIDEIAFQTNLLALNAAVEAARAGQHGKGFAVVAEEVRNLAARSAKAASETAELIEGSVEKTSNGTQIAERTAKALDEIVGSIGKVTDLIGEIAASSNEQAQGIAQVNIGMQQIDQVIQQTTASAEESAATSEELSNQAAELKHQLSRFKLKGSYNQGYSPAPTLQLSLPAQNNTSGWGNVSAPPAQQDNSGQMFQWKDTYNTGVTLMDQQHRRLVDLINQLFKCMKDGGDRMILADVVDELVNYTVTHFRAEEDIMRKHNYPDFDAHQQIHKNFVEKVGVYADKLKSGERLPPADIYNFLKDWLISHIEKQDRDGYGKFLQ